MVTVRIPVHSNKYPDLFALIDEEDYSLVSAHRWSVSRRSYTTYAYTNVRDADGVHMISMHRLILGETRRVDVDHRDHNGLNNTRANLRRASRSQNSANQQPRSGLSSAYKGVSWDKKTNKWVANINKDGRRTRIGYFACEANAARAYDSKAAELYGEFAYLNFPNGAP